MLTENTIDKLIAEVRLGGVDLRDQKYFQAIFEDGTLKTLNLTGSLGPISRLPMTLFEFAKLQFLNISENNLKHIDTKIGKLTSLIELNASHNSLDTLPEEMLHLPNLYTLILRNNHLDHLPSSFANLTNLRKLDLSKNRFETLPHEIFDLPNLEELVLSDNQLLDIPDEIYRLKSLQKLIIKSNSINQLPQALQTLPHLYYIDASDNSIEKLPFHNFDQLQYLNVRDNCLEHLDNLFGTNGRLMVLLAGNNRIRSLSDQLSSLNQLQALDIRFNELQAIPQSFMTMNLRILFFDEDRVKPVSARQRRWLDQIGTNERYNNYIIVM